MPARLRLAVAVAVLAVLSAAPAVAAPKATPASRGATWVLGRLGPVAAFYGADAKPDYGTTVSTGLALVSAGAGRTSFRRIASYVATHVDDYAVRNGQDRPGALGKVAMLLAADGRDVSKLVDRILATRTVVGLAPGQFADPENPGTYAHALGLLGVASARTLTAAQREAVRPALDYLVAQQCDDGGWRVPVRPTVAGVAVLACAASGTDAPDTNTTALAIQALRAFRVPARVDPLAFLAKAQNADGGFGYFPGGRSEANSTALALQGLLAAGQDPHRGRWEKRGVSAYDRLVSWQIGCREADGGAFSYWADSGGLRPNLLATLDAVPAVAGVVFPPGPRPFRWTGAGPRC